jgi:ubiquinone/menaquinone biosynthesis C-methylase UbiE
VITALDGSQGMLDVLESKIRSLGLKNIKLLKADYEKDEALQGSFDLVVCSMTLHHIDDTGVLFRQFYHILKPGGCLCIADLDPDEGLFHRDNEGVQHFGFVRDELRSQLADNGFAHIEDITATRVAKPVPGGTRTFSLFLITSLKPASRQPKD